VSSFLAKNGSRCSSAVVREKNKQKRTKRSLVRIPVQELIKEEVTTSKALLRQPQTCGRNMSMTPRP